MNPKELYTERIRTLTDEIAQLNRHNRLVVVLELSAIALAIGCVVAYTMRSHITSLVAAALFIAAYVTIRWKDSRNSRLSEQKESLRSVYQKEVAYLDGDYSGFPFGEQYVDPRHAFTLDLDIFGPQSLFNRINRTVTTGGSDYLAKSLSSAASFSEGLAETRVQTIHEIEDRRETIRELAEREPLRTAFLAQGKGRQINTAAIMEALHEVRQLQVSRLAVHRSSYVAAVGSIAVFYGLLAGAVFGPLSGTLPMLWVLVQITAVYFFFGRTLKRVSQSINIILPRLGAYVSMIMQIVTSDLKSQEARDIIAQLSANEQDALKSFRLLKGIINDLDQRNEIWVPISNALYLADGDANIIPKWIIQQGMGLHRDKLVICNSMLIDANYCQHICTYLGIGEAPKREGLFKDEDELFDYIYNVVNEIVKRTGRPLYLTKNMGDSNYKRWDDNLYDEGMAYHYSLEEIDLDEALRKNYEQHCDLNYLLSPLPDDCWRTDRTMSLQQYANFRYLLPYYLEKKDKKHFKTLQRQLISAGMRYGYSQKEMKQAIKETIAEYNGEEKIEE